MGSGHELLNKIDIHGGVRGRVRVKLLQQSNSFFDNVPWARCIWLSLLLQQSCLGFLELLEALVVWPVNLDIANAETDFSVTTESVAGEIV